MPWLIPWLEAPADFLREVPGPGERYSITLGGGGGGGDGNKARIENSVG